jgi:hypothetical protein
MIADRYPLFLFPRTDQGFRIIRGTVVYNAPHEVLAALAAKTLI